MQLNLKLLHHRLGQFGLNPLDWCVEIRAKRGNIMMLEIHSIQQSTFGFRGWAVNGNWLSLAIQEC